MLVSSWETYQQKKSVKAWLLTIVTRNLWEMGGWALNILWELLFFWSIWVDKGFFAVIKVNRKAINSPVCFKKEEIQVSLRWRKPSTLRFLLLRKSWMLAWPLTTLPCLISLSRQKLFRLSRNKNSCSIEWILSTFFFLSKKYWGIELRLSFHWTPRSDKETCGCFWDELMNMILTRPLLDN